LQSAIGTGHIAPRAVEMNSIFPWVIVGLGNPGEEYANNRHNAGHMVVNAMAREAGVRFWSRECLASTCQVNLESKRLILVKPLTFMNRSGDAVWLLQSKYRIAPQDLLVVLDDLSLPFGRLRIRERGTAGGHHGLESIIEAMASSEIVRLRLGIGEDSMPSEKAEFVLSDFPGERQKEVSDMIARASDAVKTILRDGVSKAMAVFNA
jgi:PTH1 family peptidyl-tRNA hydrolase